jgi:hypothetical protein
MLEDESFFVHAVWTAHVGEEEPDPGPTVELFQVTLVRVPVTPAHYANDNLARKVEATRGVVPYGDVRRVVKIEDIT